MKVYDKITEVLVKNYGLLIDSPAFNYHIKTIEYLLKLDHDLDFNESESKVDLGVLQQRHDDISIMQFFIDTLYERPQRRSSIIQRCVATTKLSSMAVGYTLSMSSRNHSESQDDSHDGLFDPALFLSLDDAEDARYAVNDPRRDGTFAKLDAAHSSGHHHLLASVPPLHVAVLMGSVIAVQLFDRTLQHIQVDVDALGNSAFHIFSMVQHTNTNESSKLEGDDELRQKLLASL